MQRTIGTLVLQLLNESSDVVASESLQKRIMGEIKAQVRMPQHPLNVLLCDFKKFFKQKYSPFFNKAQFDSREEAIRSLSLAIKAQDVSLREQYPTDVADQDED